MTEIKPANTSWCDGWVTLYPTNGAPVEIRDPQECDTIMRPIRDAMYDKIVHDQGLKD